MTQYSQDYILIGAGIMSATLAVLLKHLNPEARITCFERAPEPARESSGGWNNAGTGHAAYCELNYTPEMEDGSIRCDKAITINEQYEVSQQFWASLVKKGALAEPQAFIRATPHMSLVWREDNVKFLRKRYETLKQHHIFADMTYTEDFEQLGQWAPLAIQGRDKAVPLAATRIEHGADVDFGSLTRKLWDYLRSVDDVELLTEHEVKAITRLPAGGWQVDALDQRSRAVSRTASFCFIGAGGATLNLLQKSGVSEAKGYGGFPVSGQWLVTSNTSLTELHHAKVYGMAALGAPPMSVPHLDTRVIDGQKAILFGPFAGFSMAFLKEGSWFDLVQSLKWHNIWPQIAVSLKSWALLKYLIKEVLQSHGSRMRNLRRYFPLAKDENWHLKIAGQRVQIIKDDPEKGPILQFGTEVIVTKDRSLAALMGASPGASVATHAMLDVIQRALPDLLSGDEQLKRIKQLIPSYGQSLAEDAQLHKTIRDDSLVTLGLK